jgi:peptide deformylase
MPNLLDKLISLPNEALRHPSRKVGPVNEQVRRLIANMENTVIEWEANRAHEVGVALAAIQINEPLRVIVIRNDYNNKEDKTFRVLINPVITKYEGTIEEDFEGCLSVVDIYGKVPRYSKVRIRALSPEGKEFKMRADGFLARVLQHEIDHTKGILFIDRIKESPEAFFKLNEKGALEPLDYDQTIKNSSILW